ncbi:MAG: beta-ketoacyl-ACP synthase III [Humidesulfovibrio sp.]|jgi:3-oxoacyl-[acyl-carrier-protein] synthase-3|uniref:beta-ketoacyl-ACP synthase III n=1 Tax=Humidesulfovibrio sp. TaxID=2910988 RepID=UPI002736BB09|nr:beta-ketoacyl-ACP synthase III [Humidesulfovibrio sp.]MDP2849237.1 beta-ketoacyl-ACP synthase III [Humidesulfovibrio sp.]
MCTAAGIIGTGAYLPEGVLTNEELSRRLAVTPEWIFQQTGIAVRRIAPAGLLSSGMAVEAGRQALEQAGTAPEEIGLIIMASSTPDAGGPATAALIQQALHIPQAMCFDLSAGCSGFVYALATACHLVSSGFCAKALVIGADKFSRVVDPDDTATAILFGDGAGAVVVGQVPDGCGLLASDMGCDGSRFEAVWLPGPEGSRPVPAGSTVKPGPFVHMDGYQVFRFSMRVIGESVGRVLDRTGLTMADVDLLIPHQANRRIVEAAARRLNLPMEKVILDMEDCGNTSAASIPIALHHAVERGRIPPGSLFLLAGFGAGLSWGSCLLRWYDPATSC